MKTGMTLSLQDFLESEDGASSAEYVLLLTILGTGIVVGAASFGSSIAGALTNAGVAIDTAMDSILAIAD